MLNKQITAQLIANAFNCAVVLFFVFRSWCTDGNVCITPSIFEAAAEVIVAAVHRAGTAFAGHEVVAVSGFDFILDHFGTANMLPSTLSVTTSFIAVYLTFRRSPYFALAYAANDIVLVILWSLAAVHDISYISVVMCFALFLVNDIYGYISWRRMERRQSISQRNVS